ncbi:MAG: chemotaxis protein chel [Rhodobacterales bacterium]|nr:MAG: chemotaxis protein chel [Rhodobacterales bacterium]
MLTNSVSPMPPGGPSQISPLRRAAQELEAQFLAQMLEAAGLHETEGQFSGGAGESQFASLLRQEQARGMVQAGGIGLAEAIFRSMGGSDDA